MKFALTQTRALFVGVALIVLTNAVVLAGVAYNLSSEPDSILRLTERELNVRQWSWPANENSSIDLHLSWRVAQLDSDEYDEFGTWYRGLDWLRPVEMHELGFDVDGDIDSEEVAERIRRQPSRRAWVVLEYDGAAYRTSLKLARQNLDRATERAKLSATDRELQEQLDSARRQLEHEEKIETRLFVIDVGLDQDVLRARYPDRQRYAIVNGRLEVWIDGSRQPRRLLVDLVDIDVQIIRVPHAYRSLVEPYVTSRKQSREREPQFAATVRFGRRHEPWIEDLALLK